MDAVIKSILDEKVIDVKDDLQLMIDTNGDAVYDGVMDCIDELSNDEEWWNNRYEFIKNDEDFDDDEEYRFMVLADDFDRELMRRFGRRLYDNLIKLGHSYDTAEECWDIRDENDLRLTNYGLIWTMWYDLDTDVRERVSDIFEESFM